MSEEKTTEESTENKATWKKPFTIIFGVIGLAEASRIKETEELLALLENTGKSARRFVKSVEADDTLGKVFSNDSETARTKSKAVSQARQVREKLFVELKTIRDKYEQ